MLDMSPVSKKEKKAAINKANSWAVIAPVPDDVQLIIPPHYQLGESVQHWVYHDANGKVLQAVCRFIAADGKKEDRPLTYRKFNDGKKEWRYKGLDKPRPLYGLDRLAMHPDAPVIVCEGEKAADAAQNLFPDNVAITSPNGAGSPHCSDWRPLKNRAVIIWRDNDDEGAAYQKQVIVLLRHIASTISAVDIPDDFPEKWDLADEVPNGYNSDMVRTMLDVAVLVANPLDDLVSRVKEDHAVAFEPEIIEALIELKKHSRGAFERLRTQLKCQARLRVSELDKFIHSEQSGDGEVTPDHREYAVEIIEIIGYENLIATLNDVWRWNDGGVWNRKQKRAIKSMVQKMLAEADASVSRGLVDAVSDVMHNEIFEPDHKWNIHTESINFINGELHWVQGKWKLQPHNREHYRTTQIPVIYNENAKAPRFEQFLHEIFEGDEDANDKAQLVLEMVGYSMLNSTYLERFIVLIGNGANGKSVILDMLTALLGVSNISAVQPSQFENRFQRAHLEHKLANLVTEVAEGVVIHDAELKAITSGEMMTAERKHQDPFEFTPYCTCWFGTNHLPHTRDFSDALFRRALVLHFNNTFKEGKNADPHLKAKLRAELSGIVKMALDALSNVIQQNKFTEPASSLAAKEEWRKEADQIVQFIEDKCILNEAERAASSNLYSAYKGWAEEHGIRGVLSHNTFTNRLIRHGLRKVRTNRERLIQGIRLKY